MLGPVFLEGRENLLLIFARLVLGSLFVEADMPVIDSYLFDVVIGVIAGSLSFGDGAQYESSDSP